MSADPRDDLARAASLLRLQVQGEFGYTPEVEAVANAAEHLEELVGKISSTFAPTAQTQQEKENQKAVHRVWTVQQVLGLPIDPQEGAVLPERRDLVAGVLAMHGDAPRAGHVAETWTGAAWFIAHDVRRLNRLHWVIGPAAPRVQPPMQVLKVVHRPTTV